MDAAPTNEPCCLCERAGVDRVVCPGCRDVICVQCDLAPTCCAGAEQRARMRAHVVDFARRYKLTPRERDVFGLIARRGWGSTKISKVFGIKPNTVNNHLKGIFERTATHACAEVLALFVAEVVNPGALTCSCGHPEAVHATGVLAQKPGEPMRRVRPCCSACDCPDYRSSTEAA